MTVARRSQVAFAAFSMLFLLPQAASAITGREVMEKLDKFNRAKDEWVKGTMIIVPPSKAKMVRQLESSMKADMSSDDDFAVIRFTAPQSISGTGLLTRERGTEEDQWLYLSELRKTKRLASASKADKFVGSDMANYDMRTEDLSNHEYKLLGEEKVNGRACYKVQSKPKNETTEIASGYSMRIFSVDKEWWVPQRVLFSDRNGKPLKVMICKDYQKIDGLWRSHDVLYKNVQEGSFTKVLYDPKRKINKGIDASKFDKRVLELGK